MQPAENYLCNIPVSRKVLEVISVWHHHPGTMICQAGLGRSDGRGTYRSYKTFANQETLHFAVRR